MSTPQHQPTPDCPACAKARDRLSGEFRAGCTGCCARAAARSPQFRTARLLGRLPPEYRRLLDAFALTHDQVKAAHAADFEARVAHEAAT